MTEQKPKRYISDIPELMAEWNWEKNNELGLDPNKITYGSNKKVWWKCKRGHEWEATISSRAFGNNCPYCSNKKVLVGYNDLATTHPELSKQWHPTKNENLTPIDVTSGSGKKVWWICDEGHEWQAIINSRARGKGCPYCFGRYVITNKTDLATTHPEIAKQWHPTKNGDLKPTDVMCGSMKKVWWVCDEGHEWQASINSRARGNGCPYCAGRCVINDKTSFSTSKTITNKTDLATTHPEIAKQWHPTKNGDLKPTDVMCGSNKKVWWQCELGHEWQTMIRHRTKGSGCPYCSYNKTSFAELTLLYFIKQYSDTPIIHRCNDFGCEIDVFIPSLNIGIEYDGYIFHRDRIQRDLQKNAILHQNGIKLYRIRENPLPLLHSTSIDISYRYTNQKEFQQVISDLIYEIFHQKITINFDEHRNSIMQFERLISKSHSIAQTHPMIAQEWDYEKNNPLKPEHVTHGSSKKVWWKCSKCGYEWQSRICDRTSGKSQNGCVHCNNTLRNLRRSATIIQNRGSLLDLYPHVAARWHPTKNGNLKPSDVTASSKTKVWWMCNCGTEWYSTVGDATKKYKRLAIFECPTCAIKRGLKNRNKTQ